MPRKIESLPDPQSASRWCARQRTDRNTIGYIPTMGALHRGHISLVARAVRENRVACASIFVNPLQFDNPDDLENYPRDLDSDAALLERAGCAMVYTGTLAEFFPEVAGVNELTPNEIAPVDAGPAACGLEGAFRPGHLQGVCAIVARLFATVGPCNAYFGEKDFQQTLVIKDLARRFDGINMSSSARPCGRLPVWHCRPATGGWIATSKPSRQTCIRHCWPPKKRGGRGFATPPELESVMAARLDDAHIRVEYAAIRDPENWREHSPGGELQRARALVAAWVGGVRLIDNLDLAQD